MSAPLLLDLSHTSHTQARTGIQRVARSLRVALGDSAIPITHDPHRHTWRALEPWEHANLTADGAASKRGARWPFSARLRGGVHRLLGAREALPDNSGLVMPELFSPAVARALPRLFAATGGPRVALFHDAIALKFPALTPAKTVARFPAYMVELLAFDGIAAVSEDSRAALLEYWRWLGVPRTPPVRTITLGIDAHRNVHSGELFPPVMPPVVLSVGSIEGRKNHLALLEACESLWSAGSVFSLHLVGLAQPQTGAPALARIRELQAAGRPLRYDGPVNEAALAGAYARCTFTVYPSRVEGFGLPVIESVAHGRPCVCSAHGALGESARGGGCIMVDRVDAASLAAAIARLLDSPAEIARLTSEARARPLRSWADHAGELQAWIQELPGRNLSNTAR